MNTDQQGTRKIKRITSLQHILNLCTLSPLTMMNFLDRQVRGISLNSKICRPGSVFFAVPGLLHDGHDFIDEAVKNGSETVFFSHDHPAVGKSDAVCYIQTADTRESLSEFSAVHFGRPSSDMLVIGITGTEGKTTTAYFLYQLLNRTGIRTGIISGVCRGTPDSLIRSSGLTTPESHEINLLLHQFREKQCRAAVIEVSSHALSEKYRRTDHIAFDGFIFTPITRDHFDFHGSYSGYLAAKLRAADITFRNFRFKNQPAYCSSSYAQQNEKKPFCIVSASNPAAAEILNKTGEKWITIAADSGTDDTEKSDTSALLQSTDHSILSEKEPQSGKLAVRWNGQDSSILPVEHFSSYQIEDLTLALGALHQAARMTGCSIPSAYADKLDKAAGRHTVIELSAGKTIIIDYAHTPAALTTLLKEYRTLFPHHRLIAVTGAAGNRDSGKRPLMAAAAEAYADLIVFTTEDPFREDQMRIFSDLRTGLSSMRPGKDVFFIRDRRKAISFGMSRMNASASPSVLFLLGKGHEDAIRLEDSELPWNELEETLRIVESQGKSRYDIVIH